MDIQENTQEAGPQAGAKPQVKRGEAGVALVMVVACLAMILPIVANFNFNAQVEFQSAVNHGDEIRARNVQRGALQLSELLFMLQRKAFNNKHFKDFAGVVDITMIAPYLMSIFGTEDGAEGLGAMVGLQTSSLSELSLGPGYGFEVRVEAESGRINLNCLAVEPGARSRNRSRARTVSAMESLVAPVLFDPLFEEEKVDGQRYTRQDVLQAIVDYVDDDRNKFDLGRLQASSVGERYRYQELRDPYQARNARIDSVSELNLVAGVDDDWMAAFESMMTIYGSCKVNVNFASAELIAAVIAETVTEEDRWKTEGENYMLMVMPLANFIVESREFNLFQKREDFAKMAAKPDDFLSPAAMFGQETTEEQDSNMAKIPDGITLRTSHGNGGQGGPGGKPPSSGKSNDPNAPLRIQDVITVAPERVYRIEIITSSGAVRKRFTGVYDIRYGRSQGFGRGAWLHVSEL